MKPPFVMNKAARTRLKNEAQSALLSYSWSERGPSVDDIVKKILPKSRSVTLDQQIEIRGIAEQMIESTKPKRERERKWREEREAHELAMRQRVEAERQRRIGLQQKYRAKSLSDLITRTRAGETVLLPASGLDVWIAEPVSHLRAWLSERSPYQDPTQYVEIVLTSGAAVKTRIPFSDVAEQMGALE